MKIKLKTLLVICSIFWAYSLMAQDEGEQSRESMAVDATASQWSFQFAYQWMPDYYDDILSDGTTRPAGMDNYAQLRIVAPIPLKKLTILPRLTIRHYEAPTGKSGFGNTELFALMIPNVTNWGTGRAGIGPLVTAPGNPDVSKDEWGYGLAGAIVQNTGNWFYGLLLTQSFRSIDPNAPPTGASDANPLGIAPFVNYRFGTTGLYVQTADIVALYDWDSGTFYLPIGARFGKVWVWEKASLNVYAEYRTSLIYKNWEGSAVKNSYRLNVSYTIPVGI
jgi:hypothetical protein